MNPPHKSGYHQINTCALRLELLMRAHEVARRINERVDQVLTGGKPGAPQTYSASEADYSSQANSGR